MELEAGVASPYGRLLVIPFATQGKSVLGLSPVLTNRIEPMATATTQHRPETLEVQECYEFTLILSGFDELTDEIANSLFEAGCDDAVLGIHAGSPYLSFDREADSLEDAIKTAIQDVQSCKVPIEIVRVLPAGADIIDTVNAYLKTRRQYHEQLKAVLPEQLLHKMDEILDALINNNPSGIAQLLK